MQSSPKAPVSPPSPSRAGGPVVLASRGNLDSVSGSFGVMHPPSCAPSLHAHYRHFHAHTGRSAPVSRIGTLTLVDPPLEFLPWHRDDRFPRSAQEPESRSRHLYAGRHSSSKQVSLELILEPECYPSFDVERVCYDTKSVIHLRSSP